MSRKKVAIKGRNGVRFYSIRGFFGTELAEEMFEEMGLPKEDKELWLDHTYMIPQYCSLELSRGWCSPRDCRNKCGAGSGRGGNSLNSKCMEEFFGLEVL